MVLLSRTVWLPGYVGLDWTLLWQPRRILWTIFRTAKQNKDCMIFTNLLQSEPHFDLKKTSYTCMWLWMSLCLCENSGLNTVINLQCLLSRFILIRCCLDFHIGPFYTRGRIIHLDELRQIFVVRLAIRLQYKDGHKTHYPSGRTIFRCSSLNGARR